jgi:hypothetical protein
LKSMPGHVAGTDKSDVRSPPSALLLPCICSTGGLSPRTDRSSANRTTVSARQSSLCLLCLTELPFAEHPATRIVYAAGTRNARETPGNRRP